MNLYAGLICQHSLQCEIYENIWIKTFENSKLKPLLSENNFGYLEVWFSEFQQFADSKILRCRIKWLILESQKIINLIYWPRWKNNRKNQWFYLLFSRYSNPRIEEIIEIPKNIKCGCNIFFTEQVT